MKKTILAISAGVVLFAGGYWAGHDPDSGSRSGEKTGPVAAAIASRTAGDAPGPASITNGGEVRAFTPGRPFAKGQAKAWLLSLAAEMGGDKRGNAVAMLDAAQIFVTMDEASVQEVFSALRELRQLYEAGDPGLRALRDGDGIMEAAIMLSMMRMAQLDPNAALAMLKENQQIAGGEAMMFIFGRIAARDPLRAEQMALTLSDRQQRDALKTIMGTIANKDLAAALAFGERYPHCTDSHEQRRILEQWARRDPLHTLPLAAKAMEKSGDAELLRQPLDEWYKMDPAAASAWAAGLEGLGRVTAQALVLSKRLKEEPEAVLREYAVLQQASTNPKELTRLTSGIAEAMAGKSIPAARDWAAALPEGPLRDSGVTTVARNWIGQDAVAASEWIGTLSAGPARDAAAGELSRNIVRRDPAGAFEWANSIQNAQQRTEAVREVIRNWEQQDPDAAKAAAAALPELLRSKQNP